MGPIMDMERARRPERRIEHATGQAAKRRLYIVLGLLIAAVSMKHLAVLGGAAGCLLFFLLWRGVALRAVIRRMLLIVPFGLGAIVFIPFQTEGEPLIRAFGFAATTEGVRHAGEILLKIVNANLLITYLIASTPMFMLIRSLRAVGMPPILIEIVSLMLRYVYLLADEAQSMMKAQRSRGLRLNGIHGRKAYKRLGELLGVLFLRAYGRSERIYRSVTARGGFDGVPANGGSGGHASKKGVRGMLDKDERGASVEVRHAAYRYGSTVALRDVSFRIGHGEKVVLMGPNGAGKSTLIALLNGIEKPERGEVYVCGEPMNDRDAKRLRSRIGVVYQDPDDQIFSATVAEDVAFGPRNLGLTEEEASLRVDRALGAVHMLEHRGRSPFELSYGQKRRVAIAGVLAMEPDILILDEPMAFLDPKSRDELQALLESLHQTGLTIIVATHDVDFAAEWADRVLLLKDGELLASGTADLLFDDRLLEQADLHLPRLARPFRLLDGAAGLTPRTVREAAQQIWKLMRKASAPRQPGEPPEQTGMRERR
ncbi:cobalt ECF transporter T component CbiQ [Paenibacillus arenilitoris]|uniref:Cobalt ECF transporter T component CbiQ n=1 Tax=Paenibacillus arenilitoris TaxID=2772299 RepID=A0A927H9P3_9BACL|nr:cobalt ECF transporter T component CbiQ [Paenibacillus arenilitoris]MBD2872837.1 cobalt ECF transporter T component CbiQ [Paenibacillus arenilitoris]